VLVHGIGDAFVKTDIAREDVAAILDAPTIDDATINKVIT
jgi:hypothetical protein